MMAAGSTPQQRIPGLSNFYRLIAVSMCDSVPGWRVGEGGGGRGRGRGKFPYERDRDARCFTYGCRCRILVLLMVF